MPRKKGNRRTPEPLVPLVSDGIHFVREASPKDQHPMRFVVDQHKQVEHLIPFSTLPRHVESLEVGTELMRRYTKKACQASPELSRAHKIANGLIKPSKEPKPVKVKTTEAKAAKPKEPKPPKVKKVPFPTTRFVCVMANPVAQVWLCTKERWQGAGNGRRTKEGRTAQADNLPHERGEYAVLRGAHPVCNEDGQVRVFPTRSEAEAMIESLYLQAPADEKMSDNTNPERRTTTVYQNRSYSVHFDPDYNGAKSPFNIFDTENFKVVLHPRGDTPLKFKIITSAIAEADRLDKLLRGET